MDSVWVVLIPLPFAKPGPFYQVDPEADVLVIIPPKEQPSAPWGGEDEDGFHGTKDALSQSGLQIKVSSKHLILASDIFKTKLRHFSRTTSLRPDGRIHLSVAQGFDARAAAIVLTAVHGKAFKTPKTVDLETLAQIAFFADKFQLVEAVSVYADRWISKLLSQLPETYNRKLILWIYISLVFSQAEAFEAATKVATVHSAGPIKSLGLPIGEGIIRDIDDRRQGLVAKALGIVYNVLDSLSNGTTGCAEFHCDSLLLGEFVKVLSKNDLLWPRAAKPFAGVKYIAIVKSVGPISQCQWRGYERGESPLGSQAPQVANGTGNRPSGVKGLNGTNGVGLENGANSVNGAQKATNKRVNVAQVNGSAGEDELRVHECDATRLVASLGRLDKLVDGVVGLEVETFLGGRIY